MKLHKKAQKTIAILAIALIIAVSLSGMNVLAANQANRTSQVVVAGFVAISLSDNFDEINFGTLDPTSIDNPAAHNGDNASGTTNYWVTISPDSNMPANLCIKDDRPLNKSLTVSIPNSNYTYAYSSTDYDPLLLNNVSLTTNYVEAGSNIVVGSTNAYRFWLDIPPGQEVGTYNNIVSIKGVTGSC